jgi:hypothetical protein
MKSYIEKLSIIVITIKVYNILDKEVATFLMKKNQHGHM